MEHRGLFLLLTSVDGFLGRESSEFRYTKIPQKDLRVALVVQCLLGARLSEEIPGRSYTQFPGQLSNLFGSLNERELDLHIKTRAKGNLDAWEVSQGYKKFERKKLATYVKQHSLGGCGHQG